MILKDLADAKCLSVQLTRSIRVILKEKKTHICREDNNAIWFLLTDVNTNPRKEKQDLQKYC